jgi:hypothetical protein
MKKVMINISDSTYEKLRFEAIHEKKSVQKILEERIFYKPFHPEVLKAFDDFISEEINQIIGNI